MRNTTGRGSYAYGSGAFRVIVQNVAPTANGDSYNTNEDNALTVNAPGVLGNDTDPGNNPLTAVPVTPAERHPAPQRRRVVHLHPEREL